MFGLRSSQRDQMPLNRVEISTAVECNSPGTKRSTCKCGKDHIVNSLFGVSSSCGPTPPSSGSSSLLSPDDLALHHPEEDGTVPEHKPKSAEKLRKKRGRRPDSPATKERKLQERKKADLEEKAKKAQEKLAKKTLAAKAKPKKKPSAADKKRQQAPQRLRKLLPTPYRSGSSSSDTLNSSGDPVDYIARGVKRVKMGPYFRQGEEPKAPVPQFDPAAEMLDPGPAPTPGMFNISTAVPGGLVVFVNSDGQAICNPTPLDALPLLSPGPTIYAPHPSHQRIRSNSETTEVEIRGPVLAFQGKLSQERQNTPQLVEFFSQHASSLVQVEEVVEEAPPSTCFQDGYFPIDPAIYNNNQLGDANTYGFF